MLLMKKKKSNLKKKNQIKKIKIKNEILFKILVCNTSMFNIKF